MKERLIYFFVILVSSLLAISSCESYAVGRNIDIKKELSNNNGIEQGEFNSNVDNKNNQKIDDNKIVKNNRIIQNVPVEADNNYKISSSSGKNSMPVLENLNKNKYEIKNVIDEEGNIKTEVYHNNELFQETPQRDRPRDNDPIDDRNRNYFDIILCAQAIEFYADTEKLIRKFYSSLKINGALFLSTWLEDRIDVKNKKGKYIVAKRPSDNKEIDIFFNPKTTEEIKIALNKIGFREIKVEKLKCKIKEIPNSYRVRKGIKKLDDEIDLLIVVKAKK